MKKFIWWFILAIVVIGVIYGIIVLSRKNTVERPGEAMAIQPAKHIETGAEHPPYSSNPPTSGWHYAGAASWGSYDKELLDEQVIHNLEHDGVWISYKDIDEETKTKLEEITESNPKIILTPRSKNDAPIALASWGRLLNLEEFDEVAIMNFIKAAKGKSPEPFAP